MWMWTQLGLARAKDKQRKVESKNVCVRVFKTIKRQSYVEAVRSAIGGEDGGGQLVEEGGTLAKLDRDTVMFVLNPPTTCGTQKKARRIHANDSDGDAGPEHAGRIGSTRFF